jgi:hypothetical protein
MRGLLEDYENKAETNLAPVIQFYLNEYNNAVYDIVINQLGVGWDLAQTFMFQAEVRGEGAAIRWRIPSKTWHAMEADLGENCVTTDMLEQALGENAPNIFQNMKEWFVKEGIYQGDKMFVLFVSAEDIVATYDGLVAYRKSQRELN